MVDENRFPLGKPGSITGILFELENFTEPRRLLQSLEKLIEVLKGPEYRGLQRAFTVWIYRVLVPRHRWELPSEIVESLSEVKNMLATRIEQWEEKVLQKGMETGIQQGMQQGMQQGIQQGKREGWEEGQRLFLTRLLEYRFGALPGWVLERLAGANHESLEHWGINVIEAATLEDVFR